MDEIFQSAGSPLKLFAQRVIERGLSELPRRVAATGRACATSALSLSDRIPLFMLTILRRRTECSTNLSCLLRANSWGFETILVVLRLEDPGRPVTV